MTLKELLEIVREKRENARNQVEYYYNECMNDLISEVQGEINAYTDIICLIESHTEK